MSLVPLEGCAAPYFPQLLGPWPESCLLLAPMADTVIFRSAHGQARLTGAEAGTQGALWGWALTH